MMPSFSDKDFPIVLTGLIDEWKASTWTPDKLSKMLDDVKIKFRIGRKDFADVQFETECLYEHATVQNFCDWLHDDNTAILNDIQNPLLKYPRNEYFCYADYKYMEEIFAQDSDVLKHVDWQVFGLPEEKSNDSTLWLGSEGAYTVCHYDTYGWNLVAQIYGRKRWIMFPPQDTNNLYPTRLPYEESSVFSQVNIARPNLLKHPKFKNASIYSVTLGPGDVLFVPRHWWHHVQCLEPAISINTWIDLYFERHFVFRVVPVQSSGCIFPNDMVTTRKDVVTFGIDRNQGLPAWQADMTDIKLAFKYNTTIIHKSDQEERMKEAVTRTLMHSLLSDQDIDWLNPTEEESSMQTNMMMLNYSLQEQFTHKHTPSTTSAHDDRLNSALNSERLDSCNDSNFTLNERSTSSNVSDTLKKDLYKSAREKAKKRQHSDCESDTKKCIPAKRKKTGSEFLTNLIETHSGTPVKQLTFSEYLELIDAENVTTDCDNSYDISNPHITSDEDVTFSVKDFAHCAVDPEVIALICKKIKDRCIEKRLYNRD